MLWSCVAALLVLPHGRTAACDVVPATLSYYLRTIEVLKRPSEKKAWGYRSVDRLLEEDIPLSSGVFIPQESRVLC